MKKVRCLKFIKELSEKASLFSDGNELSLIKDYSQKLYQLIDNNMPQDFGMAQKENTENLPTPIEIYEKDNSFALFSDGACRGNPGPGSWGALGQTGQGDIFFEASGVEVRTTNNIMELTGALESLKSMLNYLEEESKDPMSKDVYLYSDSKYLVDGISKWIEGWKRRGWKKADGKVPLNVEIWKELEKIRFSFKFLKFIWVKGHDGHPQNERCDQLANRALDEAGF